MTTSNHNSHVWALVLRFSLDVLKWSALLVSARVWWRSARTDRRKTLPTVAAERRLEECNYTKAAAYCKTCRHALVCRQPTLSAIVPCYLSGLLSACGPDASFFPRVPLLFLSHLQGGSTWRRRHLSRLSFVCLFVCFFSQRWCPSWHFVNSTLTCTSSQMHERIFFPLHGFLSPRMHPILTDLISPKISCYPICLYHMSSNDI